jgi:DNA-binding MarR family transcriptional regulator
VTDFDPAETDLTLAALFAGWAMADELQRRLAADGFADARFADGVVFQHLVGGPLTIGSLAGRLGVTQQAASKSVLDLERRGYIERIPAPADSRAHLATLTERGHAVIAAARAHRLTLSSELASHLGPGPMESARRLLLEIIRVLGGEQPIRTRNVRPPR